MDNLFIIVVAIAGLGGAMLGGLVVASALMWFVDRIKR